MDGDHPHGGEGRSLAILEGLDAAIVIYFEKRGNKHDRSLG